VTEAVQRESTSRAILNLLKRSGGMTAEELAEQLGVSAMAVRKHLAVLRASGLVSFTYRRQPVGRPAQVFSLTEAGHEHFPKSYDRLASELLVQVAQSEGTGKVQTILSEQCRRLAEEVEQRLAGKDLGERVQEVAKILDERGYMCEWQPCEQGYLIVEHNCAIERVAKQFPQCCEAELNLILELLNAQVSRTRHYVGGDPVCAYLVREKQPVDVTA